MENETFLTPRCFSQSSQSFYAHNVKSFHKFLARFRHFIHKIPMFTSGITCYFHFCFEPNTYPGWEEQADDYSNWNSPIEPKRSEPTPTQGISTQQNRIQQWKEYFSIRHFSHLRYFELNGCVSKYKYIFILNSNRY